MKRVFLIAVIIVFCLCGCGSKNNNLNNDGTINYMRAKELIINEGAILLDVRSEDEYDDGHIDGAYLLPVEDISEDKASDVIENKDTPVIVYCKSGNRSSQALELLKGLGYNNVYDFGSINNWED